MYRRILIIHWGSGVLKGTDTGDQHFDHDARSMKPAFAGAPPLTIHGGVYDKNRQN